MSGKNWKRAAHPAEYSSWAQMRSRCNDPGANGYASYGGRGIKVCSRWASFDQFLADMGPRPSGHSIDRLDVNGDYEPSNCRWATRKEQASNTTRSRRVTLNGETKTVTEWAESLGLNSGTVRIRLRRGWAPERAFR